MHHHPTGSEMPSRAFLEAQLDALLSEDSTDLALSLQLFSLYHTMARRLMRQALNQTDPQVSPLRGQGQVIALLKQRDGLSTREMADLMDIRTASLNELLVKLEGKGLIERCKSESDGRVTITRLTDAGRAIDQMPFLSEMNNYYSDLSDQEKRQLITLLASIDQAAQASSENEGDTGECPGTNARLNRHPWSKMRDYINAHCLDVEDEA